MNPLLLEDEAEIGALVRGMRTVAVVGIKGEDRADEPAHAIPAMLAAMGRDVTGIHPTLETALGKPVLRSVAELGRAVDVIDVFRRADAIPGLADEILALPASQRPRAVWLQSGIRHDEAATRLADAGITVVQDRCLGVYAKRYA